MRRVVKNVFQEKKNEVTRLPQNLHQPILFTKRMMSEVFTRTVPSPPLGERVRVRGYLKKHEVNFPKKIHKMLFMNLKIPQKELINRARSLRQNNTTPEKIIWHCLRNRRLLNCKFRRQRPIGKYIVDFVCYEIRLIIEIDGGQHNWRMHYDENRTRFLQTQGFKVLRYWNNDVAMRLDNVMEDIYREVERLKCI